MVETTTPSILFSLRLCYIRLCASVSLHLTVVECCMLAHVLKSLRINNNTLLLFLPQLFIGTSSAFVLPCCCWSLGLIQQNSVGEWFENCNINKGNSLYRCNPSRRTLTTSMSVSSHHQPNDDHVDVATTNAAVWIHQSPFLRTTTTCTEEGAGATATTSTALIILNAPIQTPPSPVFCRLWEKSSFRVCADGGANRLYQATVAVSSSSLSNDKSENDENDDNKKSQQYFLPSLITGDLDSLQDHVRAYYEKHNVPIIRVYDQDRNDLGKSLTAVLEQASSCTGEGGDGHYHNDMINQDNTYSASAPAAASRKKHDNNYYYDTCFIYGAFGGRFDQEMASIQALYKYTKPSGDSGNENDAEQQQQRRHFQNLWLYDDRNVAILLQPNQKHILQFPNYDVDSVNDDNNNNNNIKKPQDNNFVLGEGPTCGLIPLGFACDKVTTTGLKWDLNNDTLAFGGLVSTSNRIIADKITVECSLYHPILFTAEIIKNTRSTNNDDDDGDSKNDSKSCSNKNDDVKEEDW